MSPRIGWIASLWLIVASVAPANEDFTIYTWIATSPAMRTKYGVQLHELIHFDDSPMDRHGVIVLNDGSVGVYPSAGIHVVESDPTYMERHFARMKSDMGRWVPAGFSGIGVIDYEAWWAAWDHTHARAEDYKAAWEDYIKEHRPELIAGKTGADRELALRDSYEEATMRFLIATLRECKRLYPDAKWGYYDYPRTMYHHPLTPPGTIGYGDLTTYASEVNDRLAPLWAEIDVTIPRIYPSRQTVVVREDLWRDNTPVQQYQFLSSMVREAKRVAPDKPCIPIGSTRYFGATDKTIANHSLNERNTWMQFAVPREAGADGVLIWGDAIYEDFAQMTATYMNELAIPIANKLWQAWYPAGGVASSSSTPSPPSPSSVLTHVRSPAGGKDAIPAPVPTHALQRQGGGDGQKPVWAPPRTEGTRVSLPGHSAQAASLDPVHRGGRIVSRRGVGTGDSPPRHRSAPAESDRDVGGLEAGAPEPGEEPDEQRQEG